MSAKINLSVAISFRRNFVWGEGNMALDMAKTTDFLCTVIHMYIHVYRTSTYTYFVNLNDNLLQDL
jgi:hypothetical protein